MDEIRVGADGLLVAVVEGVPSADTVQGDYIVGVGDSLWSIADALDVSGGWHALYDGNEKAVGADPNLIHPGQKLTVEGEGDE